MKRIGVLSGLLIAVLGSIGSGFITNYAVAADNLSPPPTELNTEEDIVKAKAYVKSMEGGHVKKTHELNEYIYQLQDELSKLRLVRDREYNADRENLEKEMSELYVKCSNLVGDVASQCRSEYKIKKDFLESKYPSSSAPEDYNSSVTAKIDQLKADLKIKRDEYNSIKNQYDERAIDDLKEKIRLSELKIQKEKIEKENLEKAEEYRAKAHLDEEEYLVPVFECSIKEAILCFSTSNRLYVITHTVTINNQTTDKAAIYEEYSQGEFEDFYQDKTTAMAELFVGRNDKYSEEITNKIAKQAKVWVAGTNRKPRVFMDRENR